MLTWLCTLFTSGRAVKALIFSEKLFELFEGFEQKDQNYKNATLDTFIELLKEHKSSIGT